jgi:isoquinoline 1-oxidoreductase beta subunit
MSEPRPETLPAGVDNYPKSWRMSRRGFLIGLTAAGTAFSIGNPVALPWGRKKIARMVAENFTTPVAELTPRAWIEALPDGRIRLFLPKAEMGQGAHTGLAQIVADELEISIDKLDVIHASTLQGENKGRGTYGSQSILGLYMPLRRISAAMREMLRLKAAGMLNQPPENLIAKDGVFELKGNPSVRLSYGAAASADIPWTEPKKEPAMKPADRFRYIGKAVPRLDIPAKVTGKAVFGFDIRREGMLYGAALHKPTVEARLVSVRPGRAASMPGVVKVVIEEGFAGVVANSRAQAIAARDALDVRWEKGHPWRQEELERIVTAGGSGGTVIQKEGDAPSALSGGKTATADYRTGFLAHATLETQAAVADMEGGVCRVWTSTQAEHNVSEDLSEALKIDSKNVEVIPAYLGGGFGRKADGPRVPHAAVEAARLSRAVGVPVHVGWERSAEMQNGQFRPPSHHLLKAKLNEKGRIEAISYHQASGEVLLGAFPGFARSIIGFDPGATNGAWIFYKVPHKELKAWVMKLPVPTASLRGMGLAPNTFALEGFIDELAHAARIDPLQFRLMHQPSDIFGRRMSRALKTAAEKAGWGTPCLPGRARGIACCHWTNTVVAEVAEISLDRQNGKIRVHRVSVALDCGLAVNPDAVAAQVEGAVTMGASTALVEEIIFREGRATADNFDGYPLLTMSDAPQVETVIIGKADGKPGGVGEPPFGPVAAAIGNAFFALTGVRLRQLPMTPERVKKALGKA